MVKKHVKGEGIENKYALGDFKVGDLVWASVKGYPR